MVSGEGRGADVNFLDLFAGIGGFRLGMERAGHTCVGYVEIDKYARKSYQAIHDTEGEWTAHDITKVTDDEWRELRGTVDVICGGFPCQSFSIAGKRRGFEDIRGTLFFDIARAAKQIQPRYLFLENVKGLLSHDKGATFATILTTLDELGYDAEWQIFNSKHFGVPQNRERVFIIGHLRGERTRQIFPIARQSSHVDGEHKNKRLTVARVLAPDRGIKSQNGRRIKDDGEEMFTLTAQDRHGVLLRQVEVVNDTSAFSFQSPHRVYDPEGLSPTLKTMQGGGLEPKILVRETNSKGYTEAKPGDSLNVNYQSSKMRRGRVGKGVANTLTTNQEQAVITPDYRIRKLTPRECWRLQGFPDWAFDRAAEVNSNSQLYKQAGNSVTVNVIAAIAKRLEETK